MNKILITGATGHLGKAVINLLLKKTDASNLVALVRDTSKANDLKEKNIEIRQGNYKDYNSLISAFKGIDKLYFVSGNDDFENRASQHANVLNAAKETGVKHVIYTSFQRKNETETSPIALIADAHLKTEKLLKESGMAYTILQHGCYMDMLPVYMGEDVLEKSLIYLPAGNGKTAFALRNDLAEAGAIILTTTGHENKIYILTADKSYTYNDVAAMLSEIAVKNIAYVSPSPEEYKKTLSAAGVPMEYVQLISDFSEAIEQGEFAETSDELETLLKRKPTSLNDYLKSAYSLTQQ